VVVPGLSTSYAQETVLDDAERIPVCTIRNFPSSTEHTLAWAVNKFEELFKSK